MRGTWSRLRRETPDPEQSLVEKAYIAWDAEDWATAARYLEQLVAANPDGPQSKVWWFDAALAHKFLRNWNKAFDLGMEAAARAAQGVQDPAFWNLGIAATVRRDWPVARDAWSGYGINVPQGGGEIDDDFGIACIRIKGQRQTEVVWAQRICPTRARIYSVPFDPSRRFGEIVLHDGAPNGERFADGCRTPVFDEIMLFTPSEIQTLTVSVVSVTPQDTDELTSAFTDENLGADVVTTRYFMCRCCSEGSVTQDERPETGPLTVVLGAPETDAIRILDSWSLQAPDRREWSNLHKAQ